jgi:hypothetical protein
MGSAKKKVGSQDYQEEDYLQDDDNVESGSVGGSEDDNPEGSDGDIDQQVGQEGDEGLALPSDGGVHDDTAKPKADKAVQPVAAPTPPAAPKSQGVFSGAMAKIKSLKFW